MGKARNDGRLIDAVRHNVVCPILTLLQLFYSSLPAYERRTTTFERVKKKNQVLIYIYSINYEIT